MVDSEKLKFIKTECEYLTQKAGWSLAVAVGVVVLVATFPIWLLLLYLWLLYRQGYQISPGGLIVTYTAVERLWLPTFIGLVFLSQYF